MRQWIVMHEEDNVATALVDLTKDTGIEIGDNRIKIQGDIPFGHKFAVRFITTGDDIYKYGQVIGRATANIAVGEHAHVQNIESLRGRGDLEQGGTTA